jgi:hypothetical protein
MAIGALVKPSRGDVLVLPAPAADTSETVGPPLGEEVGAAGFLCGKPVHDLEQVIYPLVPTVTDDNHPPAYRLAGGCDKTL